MNPIRLPQIRLEHYTTQTLRKEEAQKTPRGSLLDPGEYINCPRVQMKPMYRREVVTIGAAGGLTTIAGCLGDELLPEGEPRHPFANQTVAVAVANESDTPHDVHRNAQEALAFWEEHASTYVGFSISFELVDTEQDMTIRYVDSPEACRNIEGYSELVLGCAPLITPLHQLPSEVTAYVVASRRPFGKIRITTKHEIGHILGLNHDDEPREIMSNLPEDRIPLYHVRIDIWEGVLTAEDHATTGITFYHHGVEQWHEQTFEAAGAAFNASVDSYMAAHSSLIEAQNRIDELADHPRVETVAIDDLRGHMGRLLARMEAAIAISESMANASTSAAEDDVDEANQYISLANEHLQTMRAIERIQLRDVAIALGLVRGFDRDEPVIELDSDGTGEVPS